MFGPSPTFASSSPSSAHSTSMALARADLWALGGAGVLAAYALGTGGTVSTVALVAGVSFEVKAILTLVVGTLYNFGRTAFPFLGLLLGEGIVRLRRSPSPSVGAILLPSWTFALFGILYEHAGTGRVGWWVNPLFPDGGLGYLAEWGGQVALDVTIGKTGIAIGEILYVSLYGAKAGTVATPDLLREDEELLDGGADERAAIRRMRFRLLRKPLRVLAVVFLLASVAPLLPTASFRPSHPSPVDPSFTYPPLKVACVVPPSQQRLHEPVHLPPEPSTLLDEWLKETRIGAGRGSKVLVWSEGAVRLHKGGKRSGKGWEGMGDEERDLLRRVAEVANERKAYILASYLVPPSSTSAASPHKLLNVASFVGPFSLADKLSSHPFIVWSTTKHHPVPLVESYTHSTRPDLSLGSVPKALPLATVKLPHKDHTPSPDLTPLQSLSVSGAICQDAAFPNLVGSFLPVSSSSSDDSPSSPQLLLNPSLVPLTSLSSAQLAQSRARAVEHSAFVLRCDGSQGLSALIGPEGDIRALQHGEEGGGSWEAEIPLERARGRTLFEKLPGGARSRMGSEGAALFWIGALFFVLDFVAKGGVQRAARSVEWRGLPSRMRAGVSWVRGTVARIVGRESEEGMGRDPVNGRADERLVEVD
ncbi:hypothetical protein JCM8547_005913 [Rhodosporidiobolus lusitaniae]